MVLKVRSLLFLDIHGTQGFNAYINAKGGSIWRICIVGICSSWWLRNVVLYAGKDDAVRYRGPDKFMEGGG
jgi:hypothetical protein